MRFLLVNGASGRGQLSQADKYIWFITLPPRGRTYIMNINLKAQNLIILWGVVVASFTTDISKH